MTGKSELTATLLIGAFSSICGNCRQPVSVRVVRHTDISGGTPRPGEGCGALFVNTQPYHCAVTDSDLLRLRPDLPVADRPGDA